MNECRNKVRKNNRVIFNCWKNILLGPIVIVIMINIDNNNALFLVGFK